MIIMITNRSAVMLSVKVCSMYIEKAEKKKKAVMYARSLTLVIVARPYSYSTRSRLASFTSSMKLSKSVA